MKYVGLIIALVLGVAAFLFVYNKMDDDKPDAFIAQTSNEPAYEETSVLVAARGISVGEKIERDMLEPQPWPAHLVVGNFVKAGANSSTVLGMVSRSYFQPGEPIILSKLANPGDPGFLASALGEGKRMMTISTDGVAGLAGFVAAGDYVDVMITHPLPQEELSENGDVIEETVTETLLQGLKVLAVDQRATAEQANPEEKIDLPSSISLEVSLDEAQQIRLAQDVGYVSLALRSVDAKGEVETDVTHPKDITKSDVYERVAEAKAKFKAEQDEDAGKDIVKIIRGTEVEEVESKSQDVVDALSTLGAFSAPQQQ